MMKVVLMYSSEQERTAKREYKNKCCITEDDD